MHTCRSQIPWPVLVLVALLVALAREPLAAEGPSHRSRPGPGVEGHVRDAGGAPLAGARVVAWAEDHETRASPRPAATTRSDDEGAFLLPRLGSGTFEIVVEAPGHRPGRIGVHLPRGSTSLFPVEVSLAPVPSNVPRPSATESELDTDAQEGAVATAGPAAGPGPSPATDSKPEPGASEDVVAKPTPMLEPRAAAQGGDIGTMATSSASGHLVAERELGAPAPEGETGATVLEAREAMEAGDLRHAQALLAGVKTIRPQDADAFYAVGEGLLRAGETAEAVAFLEKALARDPSHVEAHYRCALGLLGLGRNEQAQVEFERVLELRTEGPLAEGARRALSELDTPPKGE
jgi:Carboxypeptidase regulatory-like domain/Tetratricopeptide repeat